LQDLFTLTWCGTWKFGTVVVNLQLHFTQARPGQLPEEHLNRAGYRVRNALVLRTENFFKIASEKMNISAMNQMMFEKKTHQGRQEHNSERVLIKGYKTPSQ
jgi:hypothetical protein